MGEVTSKQLTHKVGFLFCNLLLENAPGKELAPLSMNGIIKVVFRKKDFMEPTTPLPTETNTPVPEQSAPQQPQVAVPEQPPVAPMLPPTPPQKSKKPLVFAIVLIGFLLVLVAAGLFVFSKVSSSNTASSGNDSSQSADLSGGEAKADALIEAMQAGDDKSILNPASPENVILVELDTYAKMADQPNLSKEDRLKEATTIGVEVGMYSRTIRDGSVKKLSSASLDGRKDVVVTKYSVENPTAKTLKGPYEVAVTTIYTDGGWKLADFTVTQM